MSDKKALENAFKLFNDKKYKQAADKFAAIIEKSEPAVAARMKQYHQMADRMVAEEAAVETSESGVYFLINAGRLDEADAMLGGLDIAAGAKTYLAAEIAAERGDAGALAEALKAAVEADPDNAGYALNSPAMAAFVNQEEFQFLRGETAEA